jgi:hypothetical protein
MPNQFSQPDKIVNVQGNKQSIARVFSVKVNQVAYASVGLVLDGYIVLYDKSAQRAYRLPVTIPSGATLVSFVNGVLTHSSGSVDLAALAVTYFDFFKRPETFTTGFTVNLRNEIFSDGVDMYYWAGSLTTPKVVTAGSTPATSGGVASSAWVNITDSILRSNLADPTGAGLVGFDTSISYLPGSVGYFIKNIIRTSIYTGTMPLTGQQATLTTTNLLSDIISSSMMVISSGTGIMQNSSNPLKEFTFVVKNSQAIIQTGDNAVDIAGMSYTLTILSKVI